jgi:alkylhydroperoxidase family enzyme
VSRIAGAATPEEVRARVPALLDAYERTRTTVLEAGVADPAVKALCARYLAEDEDVMTFETSPAFGERERAALAWTHAVAWDADRADAELWARLRAHFSDPELVDLGYFIAFSLGQLHWLRTLGLDPRRR